MTLLGAAFALATTLMLLTGVIRFFAGNSALWMEELERFSTAEGMGFPESEYPEMAKHIAEYLAGRKESFQYTFTGADGDSYLCFHDHELIHMVDCRGLIYLDEVVCMICAAVTMLTAILIFRKKERMRAIQGAITMLRILGILAAGLLLWAVINFDGLFITFHRIAFRNDYWLLNPRTDLLIRLMPEGLFIDLGWKGLSVFAVGMILLVGLLCIWKRIERREAESFSAVKKKDET